MHQVTVGAVVIIVRAINIKAAIKFDSGRIGGVALGNDGIIRPGRGGRQSRP